MSQRKCRDRLGTIIFSLFGELNLNSSKKKMPTLQKNYALDEIKSFTMPELHTGKEWYIGFYAFDPASGKMKRKRIKLNHISKVSERRLYAKDFIERLYCKLRTGWNPWIEKESSKAYTMFSDICNTYLRLQEKFREEGLLRPDSLVSYKSYLRNLVQYNKQLKNPITYAFQLDTDYIIAFLDYIYIDRENSAQTRDNYLGWLRTFAKWMKGNGYQKTIVTDGIEIYGKRKRKKQRTVISTDDLERVREYAEVNNKHFLLACYVLFYCFVRPKEMSKIRIGDISLHNKTLFIPEGNAKNKKDAYVTLNMKVINLMLDLQIFDHPSRYYLFSKGCQPGEVQYSEKQFRDYWVKHLRRDLKLPEEYKFYSLKDSGVTMMLRTMDTLSVRDQARHSSILMTDIYTPHDLQEANPLIEKFDTNF